MSDADLNALEQRVTEKLLAAMPKWDFPEWDLPPVDFTQAAPLPADWPQFPRERWAIQPARRAAALTLADTLIDQGRLSEASFLVERGGKVRIS
ncbi:hypothetical protein [Nocardia sp. NPDC019302]|uniref:hypothetical protein n=1 Tax=Nocardia sp. NPDC019302 TaxID=3154592 RepID=UPI00340C889C